VGSNPTPSVAACLVEGGDRVCIAIVAAWASIAAADLFARSITESARLRRIPTAGFMAPEGMRVKLTEGVGLHRVARRRHAQG
jgi:hypothetical protein